MLAQKEAELAAEQEEEEVPLIERLHARFAPSRSLSHRFFEGDVMNSYEAAWESVCGDVGQPLPVKKVHSDTDCVRLKMAYSHTS